MHIINYMPTISDLANVVKIANSMIDVTNLTDMTLDEISDQVTRVEIANRACVDVTHKDHFPLPFIDQVLERLARNSHYCFLDGFFGYMQIYIALVDQHKTTFTCPFSTFAYTRLQFGLYNVPSTF
ncbi:hypothetical protein CR513_22998, partial [Mucuna pruriens]